MSIAWIEAMLPPRLRAIVHSRFAANLSALAAAQLAIRLSRIGTILVLTRLLSPGEFGAAAICLTIYELVALFTRNGISAKVVQASADEVEQVARTAYWLTWVVCTGLLVLQVLIAEPVALMFHDQRLMVPIALLGVIYLGTPLCSIQSAFMQRENRLGTMAFAGALQVTADNLLSAALALSGFGFWAVILPKILVTPIWVVLNRYGHRWRCRGSVTFTGWRAIASFSRNVLGVELLNTVQANVDNLLVGYFLGTEALGLYFFAFNAGLGMSLGFINAFASAVYPHLCAVREDREKLTQRFRQTLRTLGCIVVPIVLLQTALAPFYVPILFGEAWRGAIPVLMLICLSAVARPFASATSQLLRAVGRPDIDLKWQIWMTATLLAALTAGTQAGIIGVAVAVLLVQLGFCAAFSLIAPRDFVGGRSIAGLQLGQAWRMTRRSTVAGL